MVSKGKQRQTESGQDRSSSFRILKLFKMVFVRNGLFLISLLSLLKVEGVLCPQHDVMLFSFYNTKLLHLSADIMRRNTSCLAKTT